MTEFQVFTLAERPDLIKAANHLGSSPWPEFMLHDPIADQYFWRLYDTFQQFQVVLLDENGELAGEGNAIPFAWDGTVEDLPLEGWDAIMQRGVNNHNNGIQPNTLSAIQAVSAPEYRGKGVSQHIIRAMKMVAQREGLKALVAPVRPNLKHRYPLTPMENYVQWQHSDGSPFDPWLRTHVRLGAKIMRVCPQSMTITGKVAEWEAWTDMRFPESGTYIIPGALSPVTFDLARDEGRYVEANVWMLHSF